MTMLFWPRLLIVGEITAAAAMLAACSASSQTHMDPSVPDGMWQSPTTRPAIGMLPDWPVDGVMSSDRVYGNATCPACYPGACAGIGCPPACQGAGAAFAMELEVQLHGQWQHCPMMSVWPAGTWFRITHYLYQPFPDACDNCGGQTSIVTPDGVIHLSGGHPGSPPYPRYGYTDFEVGNLNPRGKEYQARAEDVVPMNGRSLWIARAALGSWSWLTLPQEPTHALYFVCGPAVWAYVTIGWELDTCPGDATRDRVVNAADVVSIVELWGGLCVGCDADVDHDGSIDVDDLLTVINGWGKCT